MYGRNSRGDQIIFTEGDRLGETGWWSKVGDIVEVTGGKKYPLGMKFVVADRNTERFWGGRWHYHPNGNVFLYFYDEGFKLCRIDAGYVKIVALKEDRRNNPEYKNVHDVEVCF